MLRTARILESGMMPFPGGYWDQPAIVLECLDHIAARREFNRQQRDRERGNK